MTSFDIRRKLYDEKMRQIDEELPPLPMVSSSFELDGQKYFKHNELVWETVDDPYSEYGQDFVSKMLS